MAKQRNLYISEPIWQRLHRMAELEDTNLADVVRRVLLDGLGMTDDSRTVVELESAGDNPVPKLRKDLLHEQIQRSKLANRLERLAIDVQDLLDAEAPRRQGWQQLCDSLNTLSDQLQAHIAATQRLMHTVTQALTTQDDAIKQIACINLDLLRRVASLESGVSDELVEEAKARGAAWVSRVESEVLIASSEAERAEHHEHE